MCAVTMIQESGAERALISLENVCSRKWRRERSTTRPIWCFQILPVRSHSAFSVGPAANQDQHLRGVDNRHKAPVLSGADGYLLRLGAMTPLRELTLCVRPSQFGS